MTSSRDLILQLKEVRKEKNLSFDNILDKMDEDKRLAKSTLSRVFADGSEDDAGTFSYEFTLIPLANALLDIDVDEETDSMDIKTMKILMRYKKERIKELEIALDREIATRNEVIEKELDRFNRSIDFLKEQVAYKDKRMDLLLDSVQEKDRLHKEMLDKLIKCSACKMSQAE